ncbi:transposase [Streptomyces sp. S1D4-14]|nr:transposase [Streptomyces sp. S1D4-20]QDN64736.1 transposase [Streptomyces sp. S1D4-14]QDO47143.1 transposase [Streptomyces sp. RLB3-5]QDO57384.1 transposase [Streptomyces sp. RLB1-8]
MRPAQPRQHDARDLRPPRGTTDHQRRHRRLAAGGRRADRRRQLLHRLGRDHRPRSTRCLAKQRTSRRDRSPLRRALIRHPARRRCAARIGVPAAVLPPHVERCFHQLKGFRGLATRYDKTATYYEAAVTLASFLLWATPV